MDHSDADHVDQGKEAHGAEQPVPARASNFVWPAIVAAVCAAAGSLVWGAYSLSSSDHGESWITWAAKGTGGILIASLFLEPVVESLQTGRLPTILHPRLRSAKTALQWLLTIVTAGLLAEAYRDGIFKSLESIGNWGATSILVGLMTYGWLRSIGAPYNEACNRADWFAVLGVLGFSLIGVTLDIHRINSDLIRINRDLIVKVQWSDWFNVSAWIDGTVNQWAFRTALWSCIGRLGVWIMSRTASLQPVARLLLAALAAGVVLEVGYALATFLLSSSAADYFGSSRVNPLFHPMILTGLWGLGILLATPRHLEQIQASSAGTEATARPRLAHGTRLTILGIAVIVVALSARFALSSNSYTNPRIEFFTSDDPSPDPYGIFNLLTSSIPGNASAGRYVHARITLSHAPGQRSRSIPTVCGLTDSAGKRLIESKKLLVVVPDAVSGPKLESRTSWIAVSRRGPWEPGLYRVDCTLPRGEIAGGFAMR